MASFQPPLINDSGAVLFLGEVQLDDPTSTNGNNRRAVLLYQSAPGAPVVKVAMSGDTISGLSPGTVALFNNSDDLCFNDAGQIVFVCGSQSNSKAAGRTNSSSTIIAGGTAPNISVIAREDTPTAIDGLSGSRTVIGLIRPMIGSLGGSASTRVAGEFGAFLSNQGEISFRGSLPGGFFGLSGVFQARLNEVQTSPLAEQSITFPQPFDRAATAGTLTLNATSSSGLPVTYAVVSGPATLAGDVLSFSGTSGEVIIRATQAGNASFLAAETIDRTIMVRSNGSQLPPPGTAVVTPVMLPLTTGPGGLYSGVLANGFTYPGGSNGSNFLSPDTNSNSSKIFTDGTINFKDAITNDIMATSSGSTRLNFSSSTTTGVSALPGEFLDSSVAIVMATLPSNQIIARTFLRPRDSLDTTKVVIAIGTPGNFTKILQTGDTLPGTSSVYTNTMPSGLRDLPSATRGGLPWVLGTAANGLTSHIGIYRNGTWETTQILGTTPPGGYSAGTKFSGLQFTVANSAGEFLFKSAVVNSNTTPAGSGIFYGKNGSKALVAYTGSPLAGDTRQTTNLTCTSFNNSGEAAFFGLYTNNLGGFVHRWTAAGGFTNVARRGDFLPTLGTNVVFDQATRAPIINDAGALVVLASVADRNPTTGVLSNFKTVLLSQANRTAPLVKILMDGENVSGSPAGFGNLLGGTISAIQLNNSGQIAIFAKVGVTGFGPPNIVYGGTLPNLGFVMKDGWLNITGVGTRSVVFNTFSESIDGVTGDYGSSLSDAGEFVFRGRYSNIGVSTSDTGVFKASVIPPPIVPVPQSITFAAPTDRLINSAAFNLGATSDSGLAVTYQVISGSASVNGNLLTPGATSGLVTVRAIQLGNASFLAAATVDRSFRLVESASELAMSQYLAAANVPPANRQATLDLDSDGLMNLLEFALGGNPLLPDSQKLPTAQIVNGVLRFTYTRAQSASVVYTVKASVDLAALWNAAGVDQGVPAVNGLTTATFPITSGTSGFLRLEVSLAP